MLDLNRAASNQLHIEMTPTDVLLDILEPVASMLYHRAEQYKVRVVCPESSIVILTDRIRLKQIMLNLANNSRKFVSRGFIQLSAEVAVLDEGTDQERSVVRVSVEDSGPGIPVQKRDKLFNKFQSSLDTLNQGTGIGLCLCKNLSQLMGGELYLDEDYKSGVEGFPGARFVVDLQIPPISLKVATAAEDELFDDANVETAPQRLAENRSTKRLSFAEEPQCQQRAHSSGPAEELTGESSARLSSEAGVAAVTPSLIATVHSQTSTKPSSTSMECDLSLPETLKVLVVDDDLIVRKLLLRSIRRLAPGWTAKEASNGETALLMAEAEDYDLIIMDQYMASTEKQLLGTETTRALRSQGCKARICGLSANDVEEAFLAAGANCFMQKPFPCEKVALGREMHRLLATPLVTTTVAADSDLDADVTPLQARVPKTN